MATTVYTSLGLSNLPFVNVNASEPAQIDNAKEKKKRSRNPDNWKKEKRKKAILSGKAYLNTKGELVGPRHIGPDCHCKHMCFTSVPEENRNAIFNGYYSLKSYDEQNAYLYGLIRRYDIQRKRKPVSERRTCSYKYYVRVKGREVQVCKKAFANIHGISDKKIRTLCIKHEQNILFPRDNRGRHNNRPKKVTPELIVLIKHHILKMLSGPNGSDFIKTDKNQAPDVNISKLHKSFLQEYEPEAIDTESDKVMKDFDAKVKSWLYFKVFHEEFNSMDFHTVKRKLSDLRKSLEASGSIPAAKKKVNKTPKPKIVRSSQDPLTPKDSRAVAFQTLPSSSGSISPSSVSLGSNSQMTYLAPHQQQFPHNLQLSMLSLQHLNNNNVHSQAPVHLPSGSHQSHPESTAINLQPGFSSPHSGDQSQPLSLNLHSVNGPVSSYYLCFGHVSNLIPIPVSSGSFQSVPCAQPPGNFHHQPQFSSGSLISPHPTVVAQPNMNPQHQPNVLQGYPVSHSNHMY